MSSFDKTHEFLAYYMVLCPSLSLMPQIQTYIYRKSQPYSIVKHTNDTKRSTLYTVCQKTFHILTCYNIDTHDPMTIIFGRSVSMKVIDQTTLCFPTSPIYCFCTTLRNRKPRNCVFSLKRCILLCQRTHKTHLNCHLVAVELPFIPKVIDCMHQKLQPT